MRILVTGASGMLGASLALELEKEFDVFSTASSVLKDVPFKNYMSFDLRQEDYSGLINWANPDVIIHSAALTDGKFCQDNPLLAMEINGISIHRLLKSTKPSVKIIYVSTDAVFEGNRSLSKETDCVNPGNVYGKSKELGEFFLQNSGRKFCTLRTTIVGKNLFKAKKESFAEWIVRSSRENIEIGLFEDVLFSPISIWDFAAEIKDNILVNDVEGTYHVAGSEVTSKYTFSISLLEKLGMDSGKIKKSSIASFAERAGRASDQSMDTSLYQKTYQRRLPSLEDTINSIKHHFKP